MRYTKSKKKSVSKNRFNKNKNRNRNVKRKLKSKKKMQKGGGALNSIMSMVPFLPSGVKNSSNNLAITQEDDEEYERQNSQNVLVGAMCNQFVKNNIRGTNASIYDGLLDNLCSNQQVGLPTRLNNKYSSNASSNSIPKKRRAIPQEHATNTNSQDEEISNFQMPSFLSGMKGLANLYSAPIRMSYNAVNNGISALKGKSKKQEPEKKKKKKKKSKKKKRKLRSEETLEEQIARAEKEITEENTSNQEMLIENIKNGLGNNNLEMKHIKK